MTDLSGWLLGLGGVVVGQVLGLATAGIQRRWSSQDTQRGRARARAEEAAQTLLDQLDEVRKLYEGNPTQVSHLDDQEAEYDLSHRMERNILLIPDAHVRKALRKITQALWFAETVAASAEHALAEVSFHLFAAGSEIIGAYLRGESSPKPASSYQLRELDKYHKAADEHSRAINRYLGIEDGDDND